MKVVVVSPQNCELNGFVVKTQEVVELKSIPLPELYCCDNFEAKDMSGMRRGVAME